MGSCTSSSSDEGASDPLTPCANIKLGTNCTNFPRYACSGCRLVCYCGPDCQREHWKAHKKWCKSPLMKANWKPKWCADQRVPDFAPSLMGLMPFGDAHKYLYGNAPAYDILKLEENEGLEWKEELRLLFAASGDLRNVIKTVNSVPDDFDKNIHIVINDKDMDVAARNAIILLIICTIGDPDMAADLIIHLWYSSLLTESHMEILQTVILPIIQRCCDDTAGKPGWGLLSRKWTLPSGDSLNIAFCKDDWMRLLGYLRVPEGLTRRRADEIRKRVTLQPSRRDYQETLLSAMKPGERVARDKFLNDGLLLPFGASTEDFTVPNPTFYQLPNMWPMEDLSNPLQGWLRKDLEEGYSCPATANRYGMMYQFLRRTLKTFYFQMRTGTLTLQLHCEKAEFLIQYLRPGTFARIEVSNICDSDYLGCTVVLHCIGMFLQSRSVNPKAKLLMLFMGAIGEAWMKGPNAYGTDRVVAKDKRAKFLGLPDQEHCSLWDPRVVTYWHATWHVRDCEAIFQSYLELYNIEPETWVTHMEMKEQHTIIDKWPHALNLAYGEPGAQEEFDRFIVSGHDGNERMVEWRKTV